MDPTVVAVLIVLGVLVAVVLLMQRRRSKKLHAQFGEEYTRTVKESGGRLKAEAELQERTKRVSSFPIRPLIPGDHERFSSEWRRIQAEFVDDPKESIAHADALLGDVMAARGYPVSDFEQRSADLSVEHPKVVQNYRAGHDIVVRHRRGEASTEDLRQAMIHYRSLFEDLTHEPDTTPAKSNG
jgi:hypothetical protein